MEKHAVSRLIGAPPGYVGYDEGGTLTELGVIEAAGEYGGRLARAAEDVEQFRDRAGPHPVSVLAVESIDVEILGRAFPPGEEAFAQAKHAPF